MHPLHWRGSSNLESTTRRGKLKSNWLLWYPFPPPLQLAIFMIWTMELTSHIDLHQKAISLLCNTWSVGSPLSSIPCQKFQGTGRSSAITSGDPTQQAKPAKRPDPSWNPCWHPGHQDRAADIREAWIKWFWVAAWKDNIHGDNILKLPKTKYSAPYFYILIPGSPRDPAKKWSVWHGHVKTHIQQKENTFFFL